MFVHFFSTKIYESLEPLGWLKSRYDLLLLAYQSEVFGRGTSSIKTSVLKSKGLNVLVEPPAPPPHLRASRAGELRVV